MIVHLDLSALNDAVVEVLAGAVRVVAVGEGHEPETLKQNVRKALKRGTNFT